jgi:hypothetical protein
MLVGVSDVRLVVGGGSREAVRGRALRATLCARLPGLVLWLGARAGRPLLVVVAALIHRGRKLPGAATAKRAARGRPGAAQISSWTPIDRSS